MTRKTRGLLFKFAEVYADGDLHLYESVPMPPINVIHFMLPYTKCCLHSWPKGFINIVIVLRRFLLTII